MAEVFKELVARGLAPSGKGAKRLVASGVVRLNGVPVTDPYAAVPLLATLTVRKKVKQGNRHPGVSVTYGPFHLVKLCSSCGGSGGVLVSAKPLRFEYCPACAGRGGRI